MFRILPVVAAATANLVLPPRAILPIEMWVAILRCLDPNSLLSAVRANAFWSRISLGDPVLRKTVRERLVQERQRRQQEVLNPGLLISVSREMPPKRSFEKINGRKVVCQHMPTVVQGTPSGFGQNQKKKEGGRSGGPLRTKRATQRTGPYRSLRC